MIDDLRGADEAIQNLLTTLLPLNAGEADVANMVQDGVAAEVPAWRSFPVDAYLEQMLLPAFCCIQYPQGQASVTRIKGLVEGMKKDTALWDTIKARVQQEVDATQWWSRWQQQVAFSRLQLLQHHNIWRALQAHLQHLVGSALARLLVSLEEEQLLGSCLSLTSDMKATCLDLMRSASFLPIRAPPAANVPMGHQAAEQTTSSRPTAASTVSGLALDSLSLTCPLLPLKLPFSLRIYKALQVAEEKYPELKAVMTLRRERDSVQGEPMAVDCELGDVMGMFLRVTEELVPQELQPLLANHSDLYARDFALLAGHQYGTALPEGGASGTLPACIQLLVGAEVDTQRGPLAWHPLLLHVATWQYHDIISSLAALCMIAHPQISSNTVSVDEVMVDIADEDLWPGARPRGSEGPDASLQERLLHLLHSVHDAAVPATDVITQQGGLAAVRENLAIAMSHWQVVQKLVTGSQAGGFLANMQAAKSVLDLISHRLLELSVLDEAGPCADLTDHNMMSCTAIMEAVSALGHSMRGQGAKFLLSVEGVCQIQGVDEIICAELDVVPRPEGTRAPRRSHDDELSLDMQFDLGLDLSGQGASTSGPHVSDAIPPPARTTTTDPKGKALAEPHPPFCPPPADGTPPSNRQSEPQGPHPSTPLNPAGGPSISVMPSIFCAVLDLINVPQNLVQFICNHMLVSRVSPQGYPVVMKLLRCTRLDTWQLLGSLQGSCVPMEIQAISRALEGIPTMGDGTTSLPLALVALAVQEVFLSDEGMDLILTDPRNWRRLCPWLTRTRKLMSAGRAQPWQLVVAIALWRATMEAVARQLMSASASLHTSHAARASRRTGSSKGMPAATQQLLSHLNTLLSMSQEDEAAHALKIYFLKQIHKGMGNMEEARRYCEFLAAGPLDCLASLEWDHSEVMKIRFDPFTYLDHYQQIRDRLTQATRQPVAEVGKVISELVALASQDTKQCRALLASVVTLLLLPRASRPLSRGEQQLRDLLLTQLEPLAAAPQGLLTCLLQNNFHGPARKLLEVHKSTRVETLQFSSIAIHLAILLVTMEGPPEAQLLGPLFQYMTNPATGLGHFVLAMPSDDTLETYNQAVQAYGQALARYQCPCGYIYLIGDCTAPNEGANCPRCPRRIGGTGAHHGLAPGNVKLGVGAFPANHQKGYVLNGSSMSDPVPVRKLGLGCFHLLYMFVHQALVLGPASGLQRCVEDIQRLVKVEQPGGALQHVLACAEVGWRCLARSIGSCSEGACAVAHRALQGLAQAEVQTDLRWGMQDHGDREKWESCFTTSIAQAAVADPRGVVNNFLESSPATTRAAVLEREIEEVGATGNPLWSDLLRVVVPPGIQALGIAFVNDPQSTVRWPVLQHLLARAQTGDLNPVVHLSELVRWSKLVKERWALKFSRREAQRKTIKEVLMTQPDGRKLLEDFDQLETAWNACRGVTDRYRCTAFTGGIPKLGADCSFSLLCAATSDDGVYLVAMMEELAARQNQFLTRLQEHCSDIIWLKPPLKPLEQVAEDDVIQFQPVLSSIISSLRAEGLGWTGWAHGEGTRAHFDYGRLQGQWSSCLVAGKVEIQCEGFPMFTYRDEVFRTSVGLLYDVMVPRQGCLRTYC